MKTTKLLHFNQKLQATILLLLLAILFSASKSWALGVESPEPGEVLYLSAGMPIPGYILGRDGDTFTVSIIEDYMFEDGTQLMMTDSIALSRYGDEEDSALVPMIFVKPIKRNGDVDSDLTLAFPAQFLTNEATGKNLYDYEGIKRDFDSEYLSARENYGLDEDTDFETESVKLSEYMNYLISAQGIQTPKLYPGQLTMVDSSSTARRTTITAESEAANEQPEPSVESNKPTTVATSRTSTIKPAQVAEETDQTTGQATTLVISQPSAGVTETDSIPNYKTDPRFADLMEVRTKDEVTDAAYRVPFVAEDGSVTYKVVRADQIGEGQRFIPIPWDSKLKRNKSTQAIYRAFHKVNRQGDITLGEDNQPIIFYMPLDDLAYVDPETQKIIDVTKTTILSRTATPRSEPTPSTVADSAGAAETEDDSQEEGRPAIAVRSNQVDVQVSPAGQAEATRRAGSDSQPANAATRRSTGQDRSFSECRNPEFLQGLADGGENCKLFQIENFSLVKSSLINQLGRPATDRSALITSGVIAIDNSSKMCTKISMSHEDYLDDAQAQEKISAYKQSMNESYGDIATSIFRNPGRLAAAFGGKPQPSRYTYSCNRNQSDCRFSYDHYTPERLALVQEITNFADASGISEQVKVYGPTQDDKYLFVLQKGGRNIRSLVIQDNPFLLLKGDVGKVTKAMNAFKKEFRFNRLSQIQAEFDSPRLRESKKGHFLSSETVLPNGQVNNRKVRLKTPESLRFIHGLRQGKTFYQLNCSQNLRTSSQSTGTPPNVPYDTSRAVLGTE